MDVNIRVHSNYKGNDGETYKVVNIRGRTDDHLKGYNPNLPPIPVTFQNPYIRSHLSDDRKKNDPRVPTTNDHIFEKDEPIKIFDFTDSFAHNAMITYDASAMLETFRRGEYTKHQENEYTVKTKDTNIILGVKPSGGDTTHKIPKLNNVVDLDISGNAQFAMRLVQEISSDNGRPLPFSAFIASCISNWTR